ncbi:MAG TPA: hypothetical protein DHV36_06455 [Desulfobacteraceae bacterium]|nr:hypothetical protein [Desulfobacteraceae bacterium]|tara:strand:+ start:728 stop:1003 length:276 start_codon:yes stop_codon:yes gene_type:complete
MTTIQECQYRDCQKVERSFSTGISRAVTALVRICRRYGRWIELKDQQRQLLSMDNRMLKDIGLSRADAVRLTTGPRFWPYMLGKSAGHPPR